MFPAGTQRQPISLFHCVAQNMNVQLRWSVFRKKLVNNFYCKLRGCSWDPGANPPPKTRGKKVKWWHEWLVSGWFPTSLWWEAHSSNRREKRKISLTDGPPAMAAGSLKTSDQTENYASLLNITSLQYDCSALHWMVTETQCALSSYKWQFHIIITCDNNQKYAYECSWLVFSASVGLQCLSFFFFLNPLLIYIVSWSH